MDNGLNCLKCRDYRGCEGKIDGYTYSDIRWCPRQVYWIIEHTEALRGADWGNRDDSPGSSNIPKEATFAKPVSVVAEVKVRLEKTGIYGELLVAQIEAGRSFEALSPNARKALMYCTGWRRKRISFARWVREVYRPG